MNRSALFSTDRQFRHLLVRRWHDAGRSLPFILLNPSVAGEDREDPTSRKGIGFAQRLGFAGMVFANLSDYCATSPRDWKAAGRPVSPRANEWIRRAADMGDGRVVCGWGANARGWSRPIEVLHLLREWGFRPVALRFLADGTPEHPLMLPYTCKPLEFPK